jgi:hypothetical protein
MAEEPSKIEMIDTIRPRKRSGSFSGSIGAFASEKRLGGLEYYYSKSKKSFETTTIDSKRQGIGIGRLMHDHAERLAERYGARRMITATSQPGFFKKMGYDYTKDQKDVNSGLDPVSLEKSERSHQIAGPGFLMEKVIQRKSHCEIC